MNMEKENKSLNSKRSFFRRIFAFREASILLIIFLLIILMIFFVPGFMTASNITTTLIGLSMDAILAIGMTVVLVLGGIDLSVGAIMAFSSVVAGTLMIKGMNAWLACLIAILLSAAAGCFVGELITKIGLFPFITTLAMMQISRGLAYILTQGSPISTGSISKSFEAIGQGSILGIPNPVLILLVLVIIFDYLLRNSLKFRQVYYTGSNEKAAKLSGINTDKVKLYVYILSATLAGLAGIITLSRFNVATPTAGNGAETRAIAGAVIGGASFTGGQGTVFGALLGIILVGLVNNALVLLNVSVYWQSLVSGVVLLLAVVADVYAHLRGKN
ncbi:MAG TPA: ABC transporter permease [Clostridiaceae bacterium]|nr:ABC transporter permease [Clostridiaceae bacterium]